MRKSNKIFIRSEIQEAIWSRYESEGENEDRFLGLSAELNEFAKREANLLPAELYRKYGIENPKGINESTLRKAFTSSQNQDSGAYITLCNLLCFYAYRKDFKTVLEENFNSSVELEIKATKEIKEGGKENKTSDIVGNNPQTEVSADSTTFPPEVKKTKDRKKFIFYPLIVLVLVVVTIVLFSNIFRNEDHFTPKEPLSGIEKIKDFNILILPFHNPEGDTSRLGEDLARRLQEKNDSLKLGLGINYISSISSNITTEMARNIGKEHAGTNLVIWGNDSKPETNDPHHIYFHYLFIEGVNISNLIPRDGVTEKFAVDRIVDITEGTIDLEIEEIIYWFLGSKFYWNKDYMNALFNFKKIENNKFQNRDLAWYTANCFYILKQFEEAKKFYIKTLEIDSNYGHAHMNYALLLEDIGDSLGAKKHCKLAIKNNPDSCGFYFRYASLLSVHFDDSLETRKNLEKALELCPNHFSANLLYASFLIYKIQDYEAGKLYSEKALKINPNYADAHFNYAGLLFRINDSLGAMREYEKILELNPNHFLANLHYANLLELKMHDYERAREYYELAIKINPNYSLAHTNYALLLLRLKDTVGAKSEIEKARKLNNAILPN